MDLLGLNGMWLGPPSHEYSIVKGFWRYKPTSIQGAPNCKLIIGIISDNIWILDQQTKSTTKKTVIIIIIIIIIPTKIQFYENAVTSPCFRYEFQIQGAEHSTIACTSSPGAGNFAKRKSNTEIFCRKPRSNIWFVCLPVEPLLFGSRNALEYDLKKFGQEFLASISSGFL